MTLAMVMTNFYMGINVGGRVETVVFAEENIVGNFAYMYELLDDGTVEITSYDGMDTEIVIPAEINGKRVTSIGDFAFEGCSGLTSIVIPNSVVSIGDFAFFGCESLERIDVEVGNINYKSQEGVLFNADMSELIQYPIGKKDTFYVISDDVTNIVTEAFIGCESLETIEVEAGNENYKSQEGVLFNADMTKLIQYPEGKKNDYYTIPGTVINVREGAFYKCNSLIGVEIPDGVTNIEESTFFECCALSNIVIPKSVTSIGDYAFGDCGLTSIEIPDSVTDIGVCAFYYCNSLTSVEILNSLMYIGDYAFEGCSSLKSITIPNSVTYIGGDAFKGCENLTIYGEKGSYTEHYANENNIPFSEIVDVKNGWSQENNSCYYYTDNIKSIGWQRVSGRWYYFDESGIMQTGWIRLSGKWYYFNTSGVMQTGWQKISDKWYYFNTSGAMQTGWKQIGDKWYYFDTKSGVMAANKWVGNYYLKSSGAMVSEWVDGGRYYVGADGKWIKGCVAQ